MQQDSQTAFKIVKNFDKTVILQGQCLPTMQSVTLPLELKAVPLLSLHSTTVPLSEVFAVEITVELNKP